ncbi:MAG: D-glycerate dehydrogenase [Clostridiales bacterium]|nr:D-glycerate dehydrogenase [Clostridiales bacterium]
MRVHFHSESRVFHVAKIIVTFGVPSEGFRALSGHELHIPPAGESFSRQELLSLLGDADAVLACTALDRELIEAGRRLKLIVCYGAGYDNIDVHAATECGVPVANTPDSVTAPTAELAIALMLSLGRRVAELNTRMHNTDPQTLFGMGKHMGCTLEGCTLGIVGMGRIGGKVADIAHALGMRVLYTAHAPKAAREPLGDQYVSLTQLMTESDFVSLHCPHTAQTHNLISREMIALMKPTAFLINTARGPVVDEQALVEALQQRRIAGAALDVFTSEPAVNPALCRLENVILTPHIGSNTLYTRNQMAEAASERILDALAGRRPQNVVNPQVYAG